MNDMVKVKGQISEMALCIVDTEQKIAGNIIWWKHDRCCVIQ